MKKQVIALYTLIGVTVILFSILIWGPPISRGWLRNIVSGQLSKYLDTPVEFTDIRFSIIPPAVELRDIQYKKDTGPLQYVSAEKIRATIGLSPSIIGKIHLKNVEIVRPILKFNFSEFKFDKNKKKEKKKFRLPSLKDILKIQIDQIQISQTALQFELPGKYFLEIDSESAGFTREKGSEIWTWNGEGYVKKDNSVRRVEKVAIRAKRRGQKVEILDFTISGEDNEFKLKGAAYPEADLVFDASGDSQDLFQTLHDMDVLNQKLTISGKYALQSKMKGPWSELSQEANLELTNIQFQNRVVDKANIGFQMKKNFLQHASGEINIRGSKANFELSNIEQNKKAHFSLRGQKIEYAVVQETIDPTVQSILNSWLDVSAAGEIQINPFSMQGKYQVQSNAMTFDFPDILTPYLPLELKNLSVEGDINWTEEKGAILEGTASGAGFSGPYRIAFPEKRKVDGKWDFNVVHFGDLFTKDYPVLGKGKIGGGVTLNQGDLRAIFSLNIQNLQYRGHEKSTLTGDLIFGNHGTEMPNLQIVTQNKKGNIKFNGKFEHGESGKSSIEAEAKNFDLAWISDMSSRRFPFTEGVKGRGSATLSLHGTPETMEGMILFQSDNLFWRNARFNNVEARLQLQPYGLELQNVLMKSDEYEIMARGGILNDKYQGLIVKVDKMPIDLLDVPDWFNRYVEQVNGTLYMDGDFDDPQLKLDAKLFHSNLQTDDFNDVGALEATGKLSSLDWTLDAYAKKFKSEGRLNLKDGTKLNASGVLNKFSLFSFLQQTTSSVSGKWEFSGDLKDMKTWTGDFAISSLEIRSDKFIYRTRNPFELTLQKGVFNLTPFTLGDREASVAIQGHSDVNENLFFTMKGRVPVSLFTLLPIKLTRADGVANVNLSWTGKIKNPILNGTFSTKNAYIQSQFFPHPVEDLELIADIDQNRVKFRTLRGKLADGDVDAKGDLILPGSDTEMRIFLNGTVDQAWIRFPEWLPALISGNFIFEGNMSKPLFKGDFVVLEAMYKDEWDWKKQILTIDRSGQVSRIYKKEEETISFDLNFRSENGKFILRNNLAKASMKGDIRLLGSNLNFGLLGQVQILEGEVIFLDRKFILSPGAVNFTNPDSVELSFDLNARTRIENTNTDIFLDIRTENDEIHAYLSSNPVKDETSIVSLLTLGVELDDLAVTSNAEQGVSLSLLPSVLSGPVQSRLEAGFRKIKLIDTFQFIPYFSEDTKTTSMRLVIAKALFTKVRLSYSTDIFNTGTENIFALEHLVNQHVTFSSSVIDNRLEAKQDYDLGFDMEFRFDF